MKAKSIASFGILICCLLSHQLFRPGTATATHSPNTAFLFVEIESKVYRKGVEISSENPEERRWYFSNVIAQPMDIPTYSLIKQRFIPYFSRNVMDPFEARGFSLDYSEQDGRTNGDVSRVNYESRAEAEEARNKEIEHRKGQSGNIYSFELVLEGTPKGEEPASQS